MTAMLAGVAVVDDLVAALDLVTARPALRAVTLDGDLVGAGWVDGGSDRKPSTLEIASEIDRVADGTWPAEDNPLCNSPHTAEEIGADDWEHPYPRSVAGWPVTPARNGPAKYWPPVGRIDGSYGDRNLMCSCPPVQDLAD